MRIRTALLLILVTAAIPSFGVFASEISLKANKTSLDSSDDELQVNLSLTVNNADNKIYYLRGIFGQTGSDNYCGYTWNGTNWFSGPYSSNDGWKNFLSVNVISSTWSGELRAKINPTDSGCRDTGNYFFKVQRFTESGSATFDIQNEIVLNVVIPTSSPSPVNTVKPTNTQSINHTPHPVPTGTPKSTPTNVRPSNTIHIINTKPQLTPMPERDNKDSTNAASSPMSVLGIQSGGTTGTDAVPDKSMPAYKPLIISFSLIGMGLAVLSGGLVLKNRQKTYEQNSA
jgi:hypothetical protein